jgi:hypothetical protein
MSDNSSTGKTRAALKSLEPWADDEISRLEKTFAAQGRSDDLAAKSSRSLISLVGDALEFFKNGYFLPSFLLGLILGLALSALIILL